MAAKATQGPIGFPLIRTYRAEAALVRGFGVIQGTAEDQAKVPTGAAQRPLGVVFESVGTAGHPVGIVTSGECIAMAGGAITVGARVKMETEGDWIAADAADVETGGYAVTGAVADGDEFVMHVDPIHKRS